MANPEAAPGNEGTPEFCSQAELCLKGLLGRARTLADDERSIETDPALLNGLDSAVVDADGKEGLYVLGCQAIACDIKYVVGTTIEPQKL